MDEETFLTIIEGMVALDDRVANIEQGSPGGLLVTMTDGTVWRVSAVVVDDGD